MTPDQSRAREAIRHVQSAYHAAGDRGRVDDLVRCFTEDGVLEFASGSFVGRKEIAGRLRSLGGDAPRPPSLPAGAKPFLHHHLTTSHIEFSGGAEATGSSYFLVMSPIGIDHSGRYTDVYVGDGDAWLIARRAVVVSWASPDSIIGARVG